jgi:hypothetical protein
MRAHDTHIDQETAAGPAGLTIRRLDDRDADALARLAALDSVPAPADGWDRWLGVEVEGRLLAAVSLDGRGTIADPFSRTAEVTAMLELRVDQFRGRQRGRLRRRHSAQSRRATEISAIRAVPS